MIIDNNKLDSLLSLEKSLIEKEKNKPLSRDISYLIKSFYFSYLKFKLNIKKRKDRISSKDIRIALVRDDALGDYIVSTGAIALIKKKMPEAEIDVFASSKNFDLIFNDPNINNTHNLNDLSKSELKKISKERDYDYLIALNNSKTTRNAKLAVNIAPNAVKVIQISHIRKDIYKKVFDRQIDLDCIDSTWAEKMTKLVSDGLQLDADIKQYSPYIYIKKDSYERVTAFLKAKKFAYKLSSNIILDKDIKYTPLNGEPYIVLNISAGKASNDFNNGNCIKLLKRFYETYPDKKIFLTSSPKDYRRAEEIVRELSNKNLINYKSDLFDFIALLAGAELLISPDTGTSHFAAAAEINSIILYPQKYHLLYWRPHTDKAVLLLSGDEKTVNGISTEEIINAIRLYYIKS